MFFSNQFALAAVNLGKDHFHHEYHDLSYLPYPENESIGSAAYGKVYRVKIEKGQFLFREPRSRNKDVSGIVYGLATIANSHYSLCPW